VNSDPFASGWLSLLLAWIAAVPIIFGALGGGFSMLFARVDKAIPRWFVFWMALCIIVLSPLRYILLQLIVASAYPVQSVRAMFSTISLAFYVPIVFGLLFIIGVGLPLYLTLRIPFGNLTSPKTTIGRLILGSLIAPLNALGGYFVFLWLLPYAAFTVHWLSPYDVMGATNGPAAVTYSVLRYVMPLPVKDYYTEVSNTDREMLRNHVASFYLGWKEEAGYVRLSYPDLYNRLTAESRSDH